jgi:hypothetical protein
MRLTHNPLFPLAALASTFMVFAAGGSAAQAGEARFESQLIWATNDKKSSDPKLKDVEAEVRKKLGELPLKWENYFEVNRKQFTGVKGGTNLVAMSEKCSIEVKLLENKKVEVSLHGQKGNVCYTRTQPLPKGEMLVLGGNAPNASAWLVTLKRID